MMISNVKFKERVPAYWLGYTVIFLLLITSEATSSEPVHREYENASVYPVTRNYVEGPNQTGNNFYYSMDRIPETRSVGIAASGHEDLLLYDEGVFKVRRMDPVLYHRELQWDPEGRQGITGASRLPPDTGGALMNYDTEGNSFGLTDQTPLNILGIALREDDILAVGGERYPEAKGALYRFSEGELSKISSPRPAVYQDVDWSSQAERGLAVADEGFILEWLPQDELNVTDVPGTPFMKTVAWHPSENHALIGGGEGALYRYESGEITEISLGLDWTIHDIAWHQSGDFALLVGGVGTQDQGYWARYENFAVEDHQLSRPFFSVEWIDNNNALLAGQRVIWRYSRDKSPEDFGIRASLSTSHETAEIGQKITLSGYGSTYRANADSIAEYGFRYDRGDTVRFQNHPDHNFRYERPGIYKAELRVRAGDESEEAVDQVQITVRGETTDQNESSTVPLYAFAGFILVLGGGLLLIGFLYWQVGDVAKVDNS